MQDLSGRLLATESGNPAEVLDAAVPGLAQDLARTLTLDAEDAATLDAEALSVLAAVHYARFQLLPDGRDQDDLQACLKWSRALLMVAPHLVPEPVRSYLAAPGAPAATASESLNRGAAAHEDYLRTGNIELLQTAISHFREALAAAPATDPVRPAILCCLGAALQVRFLRTGLPTDLDQAITVLSEAATAPPTDPAWPIIMAALGSALQTRSGRTGLEADLDQAITVLSEAAATTLATNPSWPTVLCNLGVALQARFLRTGLPADLDQAVSRLTEAVTAASATDVDRPTYLGNLGNALRTRYVHTGLLADLDQAIDVGQEAVATTPATHPERPTALCNLGNALESRFAHAGLLADLDQAITLLSEAAASPTHPSRPTFLSNLGVALQTRFWRTGVQADLDQAITCLSEAAATVPAADVERPTFLSTLGEALKVRFIHTGLLADLDQAITCLSEAVDTASATHLRQPAFLANLGTALQTRFERTGQQPDLDQAITLLSEAATAAPAKAVDRPGYLTNLGNALRTRFDRTELLADLDRAIAHLSEAVDAVPATDPGRPGFLANLGTALQTRFGNTGLPADLDQAVSRLTEAVATAPATDPIRPRFLSSLGIALGARFERNGRHADLDQAIDAGREAVAATPATHPDRPQLLCNLGNTLHALFERSRMQSDLDQATEVFREGAGVLTGSPRWRLAAARGWGRCAMLAEDPGGAVEGYAAAIELLPTVAWHGLDQPTREFHLREWAGLACDAAAAAVVAGQLTRAVELLEAGRSVMWTQALHLRQDLARLRERAPELAAVLEGSRAVLDAPATSPVEGLGAVGDSEQVLAAQQRMLAQRRQAAQDWDAVVNQIRGIEGFEYFLRPVPFSDLRAAAAEGPIVIVNISQHGSHALIVTPAADPDPGAAVQVVPLLDAPASTVIGQANTLLAVVNRAAEPGDWLAKESDRHAVFNSLAWLWQVITEPVLAALGHSHTPREGIEGWPRVWWCPTGPATVLPLHAAGHHPRTVHQHAAMGEAAALASTVAGRVISSYTQTLTALIQARSRSAPGRVQLLAIGVPDSPSYIPGARPLPAVPAELQVVADHLRAPGYATPLLGPSATRRDVLDALPSHSWLHLSCHGAQHPTDASRSAFFLYDQPLTLADLAALNLHHTDVAYLAACQTAAGNLQLLDEALHLAGALQLAGYRHVLATLWNISDTAAPAMADVTYAHILHPDSDRLRHPPSERPPSDRAPHALHQAVASLRQLCPSEPLLWAPYIHLGP